MSGSTTRHCNRIQMLPWHMVSKSCYAWKNLANCSQQAYSRVYMHTLHRLALGSEGMELLTSIAILSAMQVPLLCGNPLHLQVQHETAEHLHLLQCRWGSRVKRTVGYSLVQLCAGVTLSIHAEWLWYIVWSGSLMQGQSGLLPCTSSCRFSPMALRIFNFFSSYSAISAADIAFSAVWPCSQHSIVHATLLLMHLPYAFRHYRPFTILSPPSHLHFVFFTLSCSHCICPCLTLQTLLHTYSVSCDKIWHSRHCCIHTTLLVM